MVDSERIAQLEAENKTLRSIILKLGRFDAQAELELFKKNARTAYPSILDQGWSDKHNGFNNSGLNKRWKGWLACARSREIKP